MLPKIFKTNWLLKEVYIPKVLNNCRIPKFAFGCKLQSLDIKPITDDAIKGKKLYAGFFLYKHFNIISKNKKYKILF